MQQKMLVKAQLVPIIGFVAMQQLTMHSHFELTTDPLNTTGDSIC
jgi:hypothetical protein